jgi:hypothetical protein
MALFLVTSVCDEGVSATRFRVVEAESRLAVAKDMLAAPVKWEWALRPTELWWGLGDKEEALKLMEQGYREGAERMNWIKVDPLFDSLGGEPRFQKILADMKFPP